MEIQNYQSLDQKESFFDSKIIDNKLELDQFLEEWSKKDDSKKIMFRGMNEAKFKLYNSAQRVWIGNELKYLGKTYFNFIQSQILYLEKYQNGLFQKFYNSFGSKTNDLSLLSFLQHYGAPTPLLDFTFNLKCALYFATYDCKYIASENIDNYFSIYAIEYENPESEFQSIIDILNDTLKVVEKEIKENPKKKIQESGVLNPIEKLSYKTLQELKTFYIPEYKKGGYEFTSKYFPKFKLIFNQQNLNVINQEGLFIYMYDENHPLEEYFTGDGSSFQETYYLPKIKCWNIHKSFKDYILKSLKNSKPYPVDKDYIFPQEENIAMQAYKSFKTNL
ncbi:FRG domain-containing protein [Christiangramia sp.]|uniref:FRG domain-containing protein n=1 Tax=Christiangramia sp. TaxID=1931228 RepID=UPI002607C6BE|nr:FRG domain-containing protein [Christiangramia sp.]|tara:strand:+ start:1923 stop:2924 length:1002 start_codon:yes stop_codon:yes gene_type:complete